MASFTCKLAIIGVLFTNIPYCEAQACPDHIHVTIHPSAKGSISDTVCLTSTISGVSVDQMEYYWWLVHEINSPLYTYSEVYNIDEISEAYAASVINTSHSVIQEGNFSSALVIHTKDIPYEEYRCEFVLKDYSICAKTIRLDNTGENDTHTMKNRQRQKTEKDVDTEAVKLHRAYFRSRKNDSLISTSLASPLTLWSIQTAPCDYFLMSLAILLGAVLLILLAILVTLLIIYRRMGQRLRDGYICASAQLMVGPGDKTI